MQHAIQTWIVAMLVPSCMAFAAWRLMPAAARRSLAAALLRVPHLPRPLDVALRGAAQARTGCGCDGCDHAEKKRPDAPAAKAPAPQPVTFHPRRRG